MSELILTPKEKLEKCKTDCLKHIGNSDLSALIVANLDIAFILGEMEGAAKAKYEVMQVITK